MSSSLKFIYLPISKNIKSLSYILNYFIEKIEPKRFSTNSILKQKIENVETTEVKRARLLYQSRRRGMLENDLILSTFIDKHLFIMDDKLLSQYDDLINSSHSDWDIYYWIVGKTDVPKEFDNEVMSLLKDHIRHRKSNAFRQPVLPKYEWKK